VGIRDVMERGDEQGNVAVLEAEVPGLIAVMETSWLATGRTTTGIRCNFTATRPATSRARNVRLP
jgi:hypothetical protein